MTSYGMLRRYALSAVALSLTGTALLLGQAQPDGREGNIFYKRRVVVAPGQGGVGGGAGAAAMPADRIMFLSTEMNLDGRTVKGAPYSAEAVTEHVQVLGDGNRITSRSSSAIFRDSEGRTRRSQTIGPIGGWGMPADLPEMVFLSDPTAGLRYVLDLQGRTARKIELPQNEMVLSQMAEKLKDLPAQIEGQLKNLHVEIDKLKDLPAEIESKLGALRTGGVFFERALPAPRTEPLGQQDIEGVKAEGTRTVMTIAAGEIGNERPIEVVTEQWYSPELQTIVFSRHSDPRMGTVTYRLTGIDRRDPDPSLFRVPPDYRLLESPPAVGIRTEGSRR